MYKRKTYVINKEFQYGLIATFLIIVVCALLLFTAGFIVYYGITGLAGENAFDEFIEITRQMKMRIQPLRDEDIIRPKEIAEKIKEGADPVSKYIRDNLGVKDLLLIDYSNPSVEEFEIRKKLASALNAFLRTRISRGDRFYSEDRFKDVSLPAEVRASAGRNPDPQSADAYRLNMRLLAAAFPGALNINPDPKESDLVDFEFQKSYPGYKRFELILPPMIFNNLLLMIIIIVVGIFYSHRIAGPIFRMEQDIARVLGGERNVEVRLRRKDKLKPLAEEINRLIREFDKTRGK